MHCAGPQAVGGPAEELPVVTLLDAAQPQLGHEHRVRHLRVLLGSIQYADVNMLNMIFSISAASDVCFVCCMTVAANYLC